MPVVASHYLNLFFKFILHHDSFAFQKQILPLNGH